MNQVYALRAAARVALATALLAVGCLTHAQVNVYVRLVDATVTGVDSDDVLDDALDGGQIGDRDEFRWLLRTVIEDQNERASADTVILGRDGGVPGDPPSASFTPAELDVLYQSTPADVITFPGARRLLVARRFGVAPAAVGDIRLGFALEGWEDDDALGAELTYDAAEDDFFDAADVTGVRIEKLPKDTWTTLGTRIETAEGFFAVRVEVYWEDYRGPAFTVSRVDAASGEAIPGARFCPGTDRLRVDSDFATPTVPYDGVTFAAVALLNGEPWQTYSVSPSFRTFSVPRHRGGPLPDTFQLFLRSRTRFGFSRPTFYASLPSDTVTVYIDPPALPREAVTARAPGLRCVNYDGTPVTVTLAEGYDPLGYDYALLDYAGGGVSVDRYTEGARTPRGFVFATQPDDYSRVVITPKDGGCPLVIDNPDGEFLEAEYELRWADVTVADATAADPGRLVAEAASRATASFYDSLHPPFVHEYYDPAGAAWVVLDAAARTLGFAVDVPAGAPYRLRVTDSLGCRLDTTDLTVGGPAPGPSITRVDVFETCGLGAGLAAVEVEGAWPGATEAEFFLRGRTLGGGAYEGRDALDAGGEGTFVDVPPGRYVVGIDNPSAGERYTRPDSLDVGVVGADEITLRLAERLTCEPFGLGIVAEVTAPSGLDQPRYRLNGGPLTPEPTFAGLAAGTYEVTVQDTFYCAIGSATLAVDPANYRAAVASVTDAGCEPGATGAVTLRSSRGTLFVEYSIDGVNYSTQETYANLAPGDYTAYYRIGPEGECVTTAPFTIGGGAGAADLVDSLSVTAVACFGEATGAIRVYPAAGAPPAEYSIDGGPYTTELTFSGLSSDEYTIRARAIGSACEQFYGAFVPGPTEALSGGWEVARDPTCGLANGSFSAFASGGRRPYTYRWSNGTTGGLLDDVPAGAYALTITDDAGCTTTVDEFVEGTPALEVTLGTVVDNVCFGESLGGVRASATADATFSLGGVANATGAFAGLPAGDYELLAVGTDGGCRDSVTFRISEPPRLTASVALSQNPSCAGGTGRITVGGGGGTGAAYRYSLDRFETSQASPDFTGLAPGTYQAGVEDENGCSAFAEPITLSAPAELTVSFELYAGADCGASTGSVEAFPAGGTGPYAYLWADGQATQRAVGLPAGVIGLRVTDANGCSADVSYDVPGGPALDLVLVERVDASCGRADGSLRVSATAAPGTVVRYAWSHDAALDGPLATGLAAGSYTVTARAGDCEETQTLAVGATDGPQLALASVTAAACDGDLGAATVTVSGGEGAVTVAWGNGETGLTAVELTAGRAIATATDENGCATTLAVDVPLDDDLSVAYETTAASCTPGGDGLITVSATVPEGTTFELVGFTAPQLGGAFAELDAGDYAVIARTPGGCADTTSVTVAAADAPTVDDIEVADPTCAAPSGGRIVITATGAGLAYSIDGGEAYRADATFDGLGAGRYTVVVRNGAGCTSEPTPVTLDAPSGALTFTTALLQLDTCGRASGVFNVTPTSGTAPYTLRLASGVEIDVSADGIGLVDLPAGAYAFTLTDASGCGGADEVTVPAYAAASVTDVTVVQPSCAQPLGAITVMAAPGGAGQTLAYSIDGGERFQTAATFSDLAPGSYLPAVRTEPGACVTAGETVVLRPASGGPRIVRQDITSPTCDEPDGGALAVVAEGDGLGYSLDGGVSFQATGVFGGLAAGVYDLVVRDAEGCTTDATVIVEGPSSAPDVVVDAVAADTCGRASGGLLIEVSAGAPPYEVTFAGERYGDVPAEGLRLSGLAAGTYDLSVRDANGCGTARRVAVVAVDGPTVTGVDVTDPTCAAPAGGRVVVSATGGSGSGLAYSIDGGGVFQASATFTELSAGTYAVVVRDGAGCASAAESITLAAPAGGLTLAAALTQLDTCGRASGAFSVTPTSGTAPYTLRLASGIEFDVPAEGIEVSDLAAGAYAFTLADASGCGAAAEVTVPGYDAAAVTGATVVQPSCAQPLGSITVEAAPGGAGQALSYSIDGGGSFRAAAAFPDLAPGIYFPAVRTEPGACLSVGEPVVLRDGGDGGPRIISQDVTAPTCDTPAGGAVTVVAEGDGLGYSLDGGETFQATGVFGGLAAGTYALVVRDDRGCTASASVTVAGPSSAPEVVVSALALDTCGRGTGELLLRPSSGAPPYVITFDGERYGDIPAEGLRLGGLAAGDYDATVDDENGCAATRRVRVGALAAPAITDVASASPTCAAPTSGSITITAEGPGEGGGGLGYSIDGGRSFRASGRFTDLAPGTYAIAVRGAGGCVATADPVVLRGVGDARPVIVGVLAQDPRCDAPNGGVIRVEAEGADLTYSFDGGETFGAGNERTGLPAGRYVVVVRGGGDCVSEPRTVVLEAPSDAPALAVADLAEDECGAGDGAATLQVGGGEPPYVVTVGADARAVGAGGRLRLDSLAAGAYTARVVDARGCSSEAAFTVGGTPAAEVSIAEVTPAGCGRADGGFTVLPEGGQTLTYVLEDGRRGEIGPDGARIDDLAAGTYVLTFRNGDGCEGTAAVTVPGAAPPALAREDIRTSPATCGDLTAGAIGIRVGGAGLRYSVDGGERFQSSPEFEGLRAGAYAVVVASGGDCVSETVTVEVAGPREGPAEITGVETAAPTCSNLDGGRISVQAAGTGLTFALNGGPYGSGAEFGGLRAGAYVVSVRTAEGCVTSTGEIRLEGPDSVPEIGGVSSEPTSCRGASDGAIVVDGVSGGRAPYRFSVSGEDFVASGSAFRDVPAGVYEVVVADANGCTATTAVTVGSGADLGLQLRRSDNPSCGQADGYVEVGVEGGGVTYRWTDGATGPVRDGVPAGQYTAIAEAGAGCRDTLVVSLVDRGAPRLTVAEVTPATCGEANGAVTLEATGGQRPYRFEVGGETSDEGVVGGLSPGAFTARVTDANGCVSTASVEIGDAGRVRIAATDTSACGGASVEVRARVLEGEAVRFEWSNGDRGASTRLDPGETATVTAFSSEGCAATATATVRNAGADDDPTLAYAPACPGEPGGATVTVVGFGERDSLYVFDGVAQASPTFAGVAPGTYGFGVVLEGGCFAEATATLEGLPALRLVVVDTAYVECAPVVTLAGEGGAGGPYAFSTDGRAFGAGSAFALAGATDFYLEDQRGCRLGPVSVDVPAPEPPAVAVAIDYGACGETGAAATLTTDDEGVRFRWADGFEGARREGLASGRYAVTATGLTGCATAVIVGVEDVAPLGLQAGAIEGVQDCRAPSGRIVVEPVGGVGPFAYAWSHDATLTDSVAVGLPAGDYEVTVTDARGCTEALALVVPGEAGIRLAVASQTPVRCAGRADGAVVLALSGPDTAGVRLRWSDGSTQRRRSDLAPGVYTVTAADARACVDTLRIAVGDDRLRVSEVAVAAAGCDSVGAIDLVLAGGTGGYRVTWGDGLGGRSRTGLAAGSYGFTVADDGGCVLDTTVTVAGDEVEALPDDAITICPGEVRAYGVPYGADAVTWYDETGLLVAADSVLLVDRAGAFAYEVSGLGACGGRGALSVEQSADALFAQFLLASAAVAGAEVVAIETSVPAPDSVSWTVTGPGAVTQLPTDRNEYRWRFDAVGTYTVTLEAGRGSCATTQTKTVAIVADSTQLPQTVASFGELVSFEVSPNPTTGPFTAEVAFTAARAISARVYDIGGGLVAEELSPSSATHAVGFDLGAEAAGQYFVVVTTGTGSWYKPVVVVD